MNTLYTYHNWRNPNIVISTSEIIEYDIRSAGFNLIKYYKILDIEIVDFLETLTNKERHIYIGTLMKKNKHLVSSLNEKFIEIRKWFFENNHLEQDDIISIKKDAIFVQKRCQNLCLDNIVFVEKNFYNSYYFINNLEFYHGDSNLSVKGINDQKLELHRMYMISFLNEFFKLYEIYNSNKILINFINEFVTYYKQKQLNIGYYREFNSDSQFRLKKMYKGLPVIIENINDKDIIDISYNYMNIIRHLIKLII